MDERGHAGEDGRPQDLDSAGRMDAVESQPATIRNVSRGLEVVVSIVHPQDMLVQEGDIPKSAEELIRGSEGEESAGGADQRPGVPSRTRRRRHDAMGGVTRLWRIPMTPRRQE